MNLPERLKPPQIAFHSRSHLGHHQRRTLTRHALQPAATKSAEPVSADQVSTISRGMSAVGKIVGEGTVHVLGQVEGEPGR